MNIYIYIFRRLLYIIPTLLGVCLIIFFIFNVVSPDPTLTMLGKNASVEQVAKLRAELGLDRPWVLQYLDIVKSAFTFDFGRSWAGRQEISEIIKQGAIPSLTISLPAFLIAAIVAISMALVASFYRGKFIDKALVVTSVALMSISALAYILFGQWFFAFKLGWFEISGYSPVFPDLISYVLLPIIIWIFVSVGPDLRFYRTVILDEVYQDYVRTAWAKGLGEKKILFKHILKNSMISVITYVVIQIPFLILGALLLENFFSIPGLGGITLDAVNASDFPVIRAMTILSAVAYIVFSVISDVLYTVVDPRVRLT